MNGRANSAPACAIAIIGVAGRFPGARDVGEFWQNLCDGVESISRFGDDERPGYVGARSIVDGATEFDAGFFGMHAREAELTDPQHRLFLECSWQALEDAGYDPATFAGPIGVYAGCSIGSYLLRNVLGGRERIERFTSDYPVSDYPELLGSGYDFLATRVAYKLNLRGPAMTLQSACSTSLLAVAQACQALSFGQADMMLAGGVSVTFPQRRGYAYQEGGMVSPDGHCRTFDAGANGTVFGEGAGVVVLKRLDDALAAGDTIYAVIRGFGINNDGSSKVGYTAPSSDGQLAALRAAYAMADVDPATVGFVECHGTATPLGDPIEYAALRKAFSAANGAKRCAIGSVKTNVGHLDIAAGVTGLIKTALAVQTGRIPPTLHFTAPNPAIDLAAGPFFVNTEIASWPNDHARRRAGVSAFGVGGTNVHLVLEEAPARAQTPAADGSHLLVLSARSDTALAQARTNLAAHLRAHPALALGDVARTLQTGRHAFDARCAVAAESLAEATDLLERDERIVAGSAGAAPNVAFVFPGQGSQYPGMGRGLYEHVPAFAAAIDRCAEILRSSAGFELRDYLYRNDDAAALTSTEIAQPAIFAIEYALAETLRAYGIVPVATAGHSVGEFVAAVFAGVFSLEDGLALVAERGRLMRGVAAGTMLVVRASESDVRALLDADVHLAAVNAPGLCVVSGPTGAVERLEARLLADGVMTRRLHTSHAFHSAMMDPIVAPLTQKVASVALQAPATPYVSTLTGTWITPEEATSPAYWARHCREAVRFADAAQTLVDAGVDIVLEVGPGATLTTFALQGAAKGGRARAFATMPTADAAQTDLAALHTALGRLWVAGAALDWDAVAADRPGARISLPTYPFERKQFWIERGETQAAVAAVAPAATPSTPQPAVQPPSAPQVHAGVAEIEQQLIALLEDLSGESLAASDRTASFLELGFDSLALGRFAANVQTRLGANVTFRQLLNELPSVAALAAHIARAKPAPAEPVAAASDTPARAEAPAPAVASPVEAFRVTPPANAEMTRAQRAHVDDLIARTVARTAKSKELTQRYRRVLADPRVAAGFRSEWKEMVYPITCVEAKGARMRNVDGNEYIDILNGFGQTAFGHAPDFVVDAVTAQLRRGFAIGPQTELAGEVAELFCELTGNERVTFCNTGSEAVMAALRVARTVTNRDRVVVFEGSYHGQFDEVLVKSARGSRRSLPVAAGIPNEAVANVTVLPYGEPESLAWIREHQDELAAVVVETVQSRHPNLRPQEFLRELRGITATSGSALVFDEVVTGFRMHPGGMQAIFGIRADLATYGKVVGGGLPIGILAGSARFMDALDGGAWQYGDDSFPEVAPTFVAGTFVRHPLAMAAVLAVLRRCKAEGPALQERIAERAQRLVARLNDLLASRGVASRIESYGSLFFFNFTHEDRLAHLLHYHLRLRGIYVQEGFPCFLTTEHTDADVDAIVAAFTAGLDELQAVGILAPRVALATATATATAATLAPAGTPLTEEQTEIWLSAQVGDDASCAFNESVTVRLSGALDEAAFVDAWDRIVARHDALRAAFGATGEAMTFAAPAPIGLRRWDLSGRPPAAQDVLLEGIIDSEARTPFDLAQGPLARGHLIRLSPSDHAFVFSAHHIVCDGWSINVILGEMAAIYGDLVQRREPSLAPALAFETYARRQAQRDPAQLAAVERYWLGEFATPPAPLQLPTDRVRPARKSYRGATRTAHVAKDAYQAIKKTGARNGCTLFVTLLAAFNALAGRLAGQDDVTVGIPAAGQSLLDDEILVGHCVDFLPVRARRTADTTFASFLAEMKGRVLDAYDHQQYTLGTLVRKLALERDHGRVPLAEIQFNLERLPEDLQFAGVTARVEPNPKAFVNFDLFLNVVESETGLRLDCDYNADLFDAATIDRWLSYYEAVLAQIARDGDLPIVSIELASAQERSLVDALNDTATEFPREQTVDGLIAAAATAAPAKVALRAADGVLTYDALERRVARLANHILARSGGPGRRVAVCVDRSSDLVAALLATLSAGCAYVPLDSAHPVARLRGIIEDAGASAVLTDGSIDAAAIPAGVATIDLRADAADIDMAPSALPAIVRSAADPAYVIYTSGSTGKPKGVEVAHRSVVNLLTSMAKRPGLRAEDVFLAVTTVSFDIAALELFLPLVAGATVVVASRDEIADPRALVTRLGDGVNAMQATPALWHLLLNAGFASRPGLTMLCGGEPLTRELADRLLAGGGSLWNMYGPTETTIWSTCARIETGDAPITVGTPINNTQCYVLDEHDREVGVGSAGQLHIAGDGVALGYAGRPELTAERFVPNPFAAGRMYRTGDGARVTPDGAIAVLGRLDDQVKLRGFRIELGEIEAVVRAKAGVTEAVVILREDAPGERRLVCYFVAPAATAPDAVALRALAAEALPDYMLPAAWVRLDRMPLSVAGKVDRSALPAPDPAAPAAEFRTPGTPTEVALARIWSEVLRVERVGLDDDFFALGGDSIHLFQITARANQSGLRLAAKDLLRNPTLAALARRLDEVAGSAPERDAARPGTNVSPLRPSDRAAQREPALHASERS